MTATGQPGLSAVGSRGYGYNALGMKSATLSSQTDRYYRDERGGLVMQHNANGRSYLLTDATGSVRGALDSTGALAYSFSYDPYGRSISSQVPTGSTSRFGYAGGMLDPIGLYHFGQRYYDRQQLRWTQPDPLNQPADLGQANRYAYVAGNPVNGSDASGTHVTPINGGGGDASVWDGTYCEEDFLDRQRWLCGPTNPYQNKTYDLGGCARDAIEGGAVGALGGVWSGVVGAATGCLSGVRG